MIRPNAAALFAFLLMPLANTYAYAQKSTATQSQVAAAALEGTVTDSSGAAVAGVKVSLAQTSGALHYETITDASGHYRIPNPVSGTYTITTEGKDFKPASNQLAVVEGQAAKADVRAF
jgi:hypothetical protein